MDNLMDDDFTGHPPPVNILQPLLEPALAPQSSFPREHDSVDDFEHLDKDSSPAKEVEKKILGDFDPIMGDISSGVQSFLDTEREELVMRPSLAPAPAPAPSAPLPPSPQPPVLVTHEGDEGNEFADSREELSPAPSEDSFEDSGAPDRSLPPSPAHVPIPVKVSEPAPVLAPVPIPVKVSEPAPVLAPASVPAPTPAPVPIKAPSSAPPPVPAHIPAPASAPTSAPAPPAKVQSVSSAKASSSKAVNVGEALQTCLYAWFSPDRLHPKVESLVYWRNPAKSGAALGAGLALLLALACCSLISVLAYCSLLILAGTVAFRIYRCVLQAVQKTSDGHPFKDFLDADLSLSPERTQELAVLATAHINASVSELRRLFLVEDLVDSLKFGTLLWCLTYLGAWFNGMTLIIIGYVALFTLPRVYETNKTQIDANIQLVTDKFQEITNKVKAAIPIGKKGESEKDK